MYLLLDLENIQTEMDIDKPQTHTHKCQHSNAWWEILIIKLC